MSLEIPVLINMSRKYGFEELATSLARYQEEAENAKFTVGLFGDSLYLTRCLNKLLPGVNQIINRDTRLSRFFCITIVKGDKDVFVQMTDEGEKTISLQEFSQLLLTQRPLGQEKILPPIFGRLFLQDDALDTVNLKVVSLDEVDEYEEDENFYWPQILLDINHCAVVFSAIRLLSHLEQHMIRDILKDLPQEYFLLDLDKLSDSDKTEVLEYMQEVLPDSRVTHIYDAESCKSVWENWESMSNDRETMHKNRLNAIISYGSAELLSRLTWLKKIKSVDEQKISSIMRHLDSMNEQFSSRRSSITRSFRINYMEPAKLEIKSDLVNFNLKMREDLKAGIEEEENVRKLRAALEDFVGGAWKEFVEDVLQKKWESKGGQLDSVLEKSICDSFDSLLREILSEDEYQEMSRLINASLHEPNIIIDGGGWPEPTKIIYMSSSEKKSGFKSLLPGVLIAAGGLALLSHMFLPGVILALAGYNAYSKIDSEMKEQLLQNGIEMSDYCLLQYEELVNDAFANAERDLDGAVEKVFSSVISYLMKILDGYRNNHQTAISELAAIEQDISRLTGN